MADLERVTELELIPVVEVRPWAFSERPTPDGASRDHRGAWLQYWLDCLADAGVSDLHPIEPGSMHVATSAFTDPVVLGQILRRLVESESLTDESTTTLDGGVALVSNGRVLVEPSCCGDLGDWTEWRAVAETQTAA